MCGTDVAKEFVNEIRVKCGHRRIGKLRKGYRWSPTMCPIARGLEVCGVERVFPAEPAWVILFAKDGKYLPYERPEVVQWMEDFDEGKYPELVIPPTPIKMKKLGERKQTVVG